MSGTNAHVVLEAAPEATTARKPTQAPATAERTHHVLALSAKSLVCPAMALITES